METRQQTDVLDIFVRIVNFSRFFVTHDDKYRERHAIRGERGECRVEGGNIYKHLAATVLCCDDDEKAISILKHRFLELTGTNFENTILTSFVA